MSISAVRAYLTPLGFADRIREFPVSSATVELAAKALGVAGARIAKTMSFKVADGVVLIVTAGDRKIDNHLYKARFGTKAKMLTAEEVEPLTGHQIGGVCPFALPQAVKVYCDESLKRFETVYPAAGSANSAVELSCEELFTLSGAEAWVDLCKPILPAEGSIHV